MHIVIRLSIIFIPGKQRAAPQRNSQTRERCVPQRLLSSGRRAQPAQLAVALRSHVSGTWQKRTSLRSARKLAPKRAANIHWAEQKNENPAARPGKASLEQ